MKLEPGIVIDGRYRLEHRLGSGGMADVWRARDTELGRDVALKLLHENFARDKEFVERFRREASSAAGLQHQNVVSVFDRGSYEDSYYISMELVEGSSLRELIDQGLEIDEAVEVTRQMLAAAEFAHEHGIVHRDLKPMNVLIDRDGRVRVTDFGIARAGGSEITRTGSVMGTAQYLSPEQAQGMEVTGAADIYAIGVILFEMLCKRVPFEGDSAVAIAMKQVGEEPPRPSSINPKVSPALDAVVLKALAKDPAERYGSAAEMAAALEAAVANPDQPPPAALGREDRSRRRWLIAALLVLLIAGGALAWFLTRPDLVAVPDVTGEQEAAATIELQAADFEVATERIESDIPEGEVIEQDPSGGTEAEQGSAVTITVSLGPGTVKVPRVAGLSVPEARKVLRDKGFEVAIDKRASESVPAGKVIGSDPRQGTNLEDGETVTLLVSTGVETEIVPNVLGLDRVTATAQLRRAGFVVNANPTRSDEPEDEVLEQDPPAGEEAEVGSEVTITYSSGVGTITLSDYVGQKLTYAQRKLAAEGLSVSVVKRDTTDSSEDGIVLAQAPSAGTNMSPGERVTLTVGEFTEPESTTTDTTDTTTTGRRAR
ncbi:MAG TPA: PASTA domain-containing protein [Solirubrobacterales bacterium]|nr:PASTA domain-containing protein [Solirubrobacterales bacterium]